MSLDPKVKEAIEGAVAESGQDATLALKLIRWFEAIASGSEQISDRQSAFRHLELLYEAAQPKVLDLEELERLLGTSEDQESK
jgi:hypothetical protein